MLSSFLLSALLYTAALPLGHEGVEWGASVEQLKQKYSVHKASPGSEYNYADHTEINPDVYVRKKKDHTRVEYYFFKSRLYKIYVIYGRQASGSKLYQHLVNQNQQRFGQPEQQYKQFKFGLMVYHTLWSDKVSTLDVRYGAGFVYEVLQNTEAVQRKQRQQQVDKSI